MAKRHGTLLFTLAPAAAATAPGTLISNLRQHREVPMRKKHFARSLLGSFAIVAGLLFPMEADAQERVDFRFIGDNLLGRPSLTIGSLTVTGSDVVTYLENLGLGIGTAGSFFAAIQPGETVSLSFASPASNVTIDLCNGNSLPVLLTLRDASGASLGQATAQMNSGEVCLDISAEFNAAPVSRVDITIDTENVPPEANCPVCFFSLAVVTFEDGDSDNDGVSDDLDNCPNVANPDQADADGDGVGDACEADRDGDGVSDDDDNCPLVPNDDQLDTDGDGLGDACDQANDGDGDGVDDDVDNCPLDPNPGQEDADGDGVGDACDPDRDGDGVDDTADNCPFQPNADQLDTDGDGAGDACDADDDNDNVDDAGDNCPDIANSNQADNDGDSAGDACDADDDNDTVADAGDNCPLDPNADQADADGDGTGDLCDADLDGDGVPDSADQCVPTASGQVVNGEGCAIAQICPCNNNWRNHVAYVACVARTANDFREDGLISLRELARIVLQAGRSRCGARSGN